MTTLKELQESFQRGILAGDDKILSEVKDSGKERREVLFDVYRNGYVARLAEIMGEDYERTHEYLGDARFAQADQGLYRREPFRPAKREMVRAAPSAPLSGAPSLIRSHPELVELATLEKALNDAFDAADADPLRARGSGRGRA